MYPNNLNVTARTPEDGTAVKVLKDPESVEGEQSFQSFYLSIICEASKYFLADTGEIIKGNLIEDKSDYALKYAKFHFEQLTFSNKKRVLDNAEEVIKAIKHNALEDKALHGLRVELTKRLSTEASWLIDKSISGKLTPLVMLAYVAIGLKEGALK